MYQCNRCKKIMTPSAWHEHECEDMRSLKEMPTDILTEVANKVLTEEEAWEIVDKKKN